MTTKHETQTHHQPQPAKIGSINILRFVAAISVMFYHFTFVFYHRDQSYIDLPIFRHLFQYGYLGVDLFFIISGFVILLSVEGRGAYGFIKSRLGRLYPVFWSCAIITSLFLLCGGSLIYSHLSWYRFWTNMTMVHGLIADGSRYDLLDGSYWTLVTEIKFYFFILVLLLTKQLKRIELLSTITAVGITLAICLLKLPLIWIPNFIAGIIFYKIYRDGLTNWRIFALCNTFFSSIYFAIGRIGDLETGYKTAFSPTVIILYILAFYILFILISLRKIRVHNNVYINLFGILTYPVYLLHQQIARILFTYADIHHIPLYISFTSIVFFILLTAFVVHKLFEYRGKIMIENILDKVIPSSLKRL